MQMPFDLDPDLLLLSAKKLLSLALLPPLAPMLVVLAGLLLARRGRRGGPAIVWAGLLAMYALSTPAGVGWMLAGLETTPPLSAEAARRAQAIVILAGGQRRHAPEFGGPTINALSLERLRYGARLARQTGLPVLLSGGTLREEFAEAQLMREALLQDFGIAAQWTESTSRDTRENARNSALALGREGIARILLVTHAAHMPRARAEFAAAGLEVIAAPTAWQSAPGGEALELRDFVPTPRAAFSGWYATHEWLGLLALRLRPSGP